MGLTVTGFDGGTYAVGDTVRRVRDGVRTSLFGKVLQIGEAEHVQGMVRVAGSIAWESPRSFEKVHLMEPAPC